ncbi:MAG: PolC-type DNA polymerase III [Clostridia bacterium]|nr:PolC-type DNA polymerase III [Clostridia bacterium]
MPPITDLIADTGKISDIENIEITRAKLYSAGKKLELFIKPHRFLSEKETTSICSAVKKEYPGIAVFCQYDYSHLDLTDKELEIYYPHILARLSEKFSIAHCLLSDAEKHINENVLEIITKNEGVDILNSGGCAGILKSLLLEETGKKYEVVIRTSGGPMPELPKIEDVIKMPTQEEPEARPEPVIAPPEIDLPEPPKAEYSAILKGRKIFDTEPVQIISVTREQSDVVIRGDVLFVETKETKNGRTILSFALTDYTSSIKVKSFEGAKADADEDKKEKAAKKLDKILCGLKAGAYVAVSGRVTFDEYDKELVLMASNINLLEKEVVTDNAEVKRVELHLHTKMSAMDGVSGVKDLVNRAADWGHPAIAITDHGVAQAFPDAFDVARKRGIKVLYGVEGYLCSNELAITYNVKQDYTLDSSFVVFDLETTGFSPVDDSIIEIGAVKIVNGEITERYSTFVNPHRHIPDNITEITSITDQMVSDAPDISVAAKEFEDFSKGSVLVAHNANFDVGFMRVVYENLGMEFDYCYLDTLELCRALFTDQKRHGLAAMVKYLNITLDNHHRAVDDAEATAEILKRCFTILKDKGITDIELFNTDLCEDSRKAKYHHFVMIAQNKKGLENMYRIVSEAHLKHFYRKPLVPKSLIETYREGILLGSACEAGEVYKAVLNGKKQKEIDKLASFYDYLEIQPDGNNEFMIRSGRVSGKGALHKINKTIIETADRLGKPVVATGDVHFLNPSDEAFRRILMDSLGFEDADRQASLYFRTTEQMLEEFSYLGEELAYKVVVQNTNKIADMVENIQLLPDEPHTPEMDGAEEDIVNISTKRAIEIYGDPLPEQVKSRMDRELGSIIKHGFSVLYIIAQKLVWKSLSDGYLVGSRGSVGSSFIAFLLGITEVNALQPHYVCPGCKHSEFITDGSAPSGVDMPDKKCPVCGVMLDKNGHDIPFETFLGFDGDKEPDIDLNFSGDYQPVAHKYTEELFGEGFVFRAGTIGTVAEKTAYGFVKKYFEKRGMTPAEAEINRLVKGCTGVKRTTGQHPGGIMVVPRKEDIHWYCPVQHPADDNDTDIITTHFDYHSISGRLLKLDILGHDDPTVIRMLEDFTNTKATDIKIGEEKTMSLFTSTEALGVTPEQIGSTVGSYGVPEFGTKFVRKMLVDTKPTTFAELVRISGLSHGTDVWTNNAEELVKSGTATLKEVICTRDDIMTYLIYAGLPKKDAFKIMESVRKGKGLTPEQEQLMVDNNVPEWYIDSCKKIKYMFPKAHAVAYVMMAFRIAYYKVYYPVEYYCTYFTVRADEFDAGLMIGRENIEKNLKELGEIEKPSQKEKNLITILEMCREMYARGIEFSGLDLYKSDSHKFLPADGKIIPPFSALPGLGGAAAAGIVEARNEGEFYSVKEFADRAHVSKTLIQLMKDYHILDGLPETDQVSFF